MSQTHSPTDPFGPPCNCPAPTPGATAPRLCAFVSSRPTHYGGVVTLSAALWGGHHTRDLPLDRGQALELSRELMAHVRRLAGAESARRTRARLGARGTSAPQRRVGAATAAGGYGGGADVTVTARSRPRPLVESGR